MPIYVEPIYNSVTNEKVVSAFYTGFLSSNIQPVMKQEILATPSYTQLKKEQAKGFGG